MNKDKKIEKEVSKTLCSLDTIEEAKAGPHFYARLEQRINSRNAIAIQDIWAILWREPKYLLGAFSIVLMIVVNIYSVIQYDQFPEWESINTEEVESTLAEEYVVDLPVLYND